MYGQSLELEAELLKVLGHPARLRIIQLLAERESCVCELIPAVGLEQSNLSQHLKLLRKHGIVAARRDGTRIIYRLVNPQIVAVLTAASEAVQNHLDRMVSLATTRGAL